MKKGFKKILLILFGFPISISLFLIFFIITTLLWPLYIIGKLFELIVKLFNNEYNSDIINYFLEFIFAMYGFSALFLLVLFYVYE